MILEPLPSYLDNLFVVTTRTRSTGQLQVCKYSSSSLPLNFDSECFRYYLADFSHLDRVGCGKDGRTSKDISKREAA